MPLAAEHSDIHLHHDQAAALRTRTAGRTNLAAPHWCAQRSLIATFCMILHTFTAVRVDWLAGLRQVTLASCVFDTVLWQELQQLQQLQHLTLP